MGKNFRKIVAKQRHFHAVARKQPGNDTPALAFSHILPTSAIISMLMLKNNVTDLILVPLLLISTICHTLF